MIDTTSLNYYNDLANFIKFRMKNLAYILTIVDMVVMVLLIITVALQNKSSGLSTVFGGGGVTTTRRGADKWLFYATIVLGILFSGLSLTIVLLSK